MQVLHDVEVPHDVDELHDVPAAYVEMGNHSALGLPEDLRNICACPFVYMPTNSQLGIKRSGNSDVCLLVTVEKLFFNSLFNY